MTRLLRCLQSVVANILQGADLVSLGTCALVQQSAPGLWSLELQGHHLNVTYIMTLGARRCCLR